MPWRLSPPNEALEQAPLADAREEETASNPPLAKDEPASNTPDGAPLTNVGEGEPAANTTNEAPTSLNSFYLFLCFLFQFFIFFKKTWNVMALWSRQL